MIWVSVALGVVEPVSAIMIALFVLRHTGPLGLFWWTRFFLALLAAGLILHAAQQWVLILDYRPPRTWAWLPVMAAMNGVIWTVHFTDLHRRRYGPPSTRPRQMGQGKVS